MDKRRKARKRAMEYERALRQFVHYPVSGEMVGYLADRTCEVISCGTAGSPASTRVTSTVPIMPLEQFIALLVERSGVHTSTLMATLVYLDRLAQKLPRLARGMGCTYHRVFLAALILASKYLNDSSPKNKHWARHTGGLFNLAEVNLMEKQMLFLLEWDPKITMTDLVKYLHPFLEPIVVRERRMRQRQLPINTKVTINTGLPTPPGSATLPSPVRLNSIPSGVKLTAAKYPYDPINVMSHGQPFQRHGSRYVADSDIDSPSMVPSLSNASISSQESDIDELDCCNIPVRRLDYNPALNYDYARNKSISSIKLPNEYNMDNGIKERSFYDRARRKLRILPSLSH